MVLISHFFIINMEKIVTKFKERNNLDGMTDKKMKMTKNYEFQYNLTVYYLCTNQSGGND